jgi:GntR family transcriptional regulator
LEQTLQDPPQADATSGAPTRAPRTPRGRASFEPAYLHIANTIAEQIGAGVYRPGDQLPTEQQLRRQFRVSPATVRRAIAILLSRGLVTTTQGKGTFVRAQGIGEAVFRLQEITDTWTGDESVEVRLLEAGIRPAEGRAAEMLNLTLGEPLVYMRRLIERQGTPLVYQVEHVIYDERRPLVESQLQTTSLDGVLAAERGEGMPSGRLTIQAVSLDADEARHLKVPEDSPALCLDHLCLDFQGRPVSWGRFVCRADQFQLSTHIGVSPEGVGAA